MSWHVRYNAETGESVLVFPSAEGAIEAACSLADSGFQVLGIGARDRGASFAEVEIGAIYAIWARAKNPFGRISV